MAEELDWLTETGGDTLDGLASLLDKSLIRKVDPDDAASRLLMLETIKEYAAERLEELPEFAAAARRAHAAYFADFAKRQWQHLTGSGERPPWRPCRLTSTTSAWPGVTGSPSVTGSSSTSWSTACGCSTTPGAGTRTRSG